MASTFSQQLRYLKRHEPALYESISKVYRKCLMESNLAPEMAQTDDEAAETPVEKTEIKQTRTKGVDDLMDKVHAMVGVNENKKEGDEIFDAKKDDVETVQPDPQQQADLFGMDNGSQEAAPTEELSDMDLENLFTDEEQTDTGTEQPAEETPTTEEAPQTEEAPTTEEPAAEPAAEPATDQSQATGQEDVGDFDFDNLF